MRKITVIITFIILFVSMFALAQDIVKEEALAPEPIKVLIYDLNILKDEVLFTTINKETDEKRFREILGQVFCGDYSLAVVTENLKLNPASPETLEFISNLYEEFQTDTILRESFNDDFRYFMLNREKSLGEPLIKYIVVPKIQPKPKEVLTEDSQMISRLKAFGFYDYVILLEKMGASDVTSTGEFLMRITHLSNELHAEFYDDPLLREVFDDDYSEFVTDKRKSLEVHP